MAAGGLMYTASFTGSTLPAAATGIWEVTAAAGVPIIIHSMRVTFTPVITSGVAQDVRLSLISTRMSAAGSGGAAATPRAVNSRNTVVAAGTYTGMQTTPGTATNTLDAEIVSVIVPFERIFTPDQRIVIPGGTFWSLKLTATGGATFVTSSELYVEEV